MIPMESIIDALHVRVTKELSRFAHSCQKSPALWQCAALVELFELT
jgi:hypothetical protein